MTKKKKDTGFKMEGDTIVIDDVSKFTEHLKAKTEKFSRQVKIKKAKIKDDLFLECEYSEELPEHGKKETKLSCTVPIHDDLKAAFQALNVHLALLCDEINHVGKKIPDGNNQEFERFFTRGFSIGGNDDNEGVTISGAKEGKYGLVNLNTPFTKYESEYPFTSELGEAVEAAIYEVDQYLFNGKKAPEQQLDMFNEAEEGSGID